MQTAVRKERLNKECRLQVSIDQAHLVAKACNLLARVQLGKIEEIAFGALLHLPEGEFRGVCSALEGLNLKVCGVKSPEVPETARVAYDLHRALVQQLAHDERMFYRPTHRAHCPLAVSEECSLPEIALLNDEATGRLWYQLDLDLAQVKAVSTACLLFSRAQKGLLREAVCVVMGHLPTDDIWRISNTLIALDKEIAPFCQKIFPDIANVAYDLHQVFQHYLLSVDQEDGSAVSVEPVQTSLVSPLACIEPIGEGY